MSRLLRLTSLIYVILYLGGTLQAELMFVQHGRAAVSTSPFGVSKEGGTNNFSTPSGSNPGDYRMSFGTGTGHAQGVMMTSVRENGRGGIFAAAAAARSFAPSTHDGQYFVAIHRSNSSLEHDINVAVAYFPFDKFLGGAAYNADNGLPLNELVASPGIDAGDEFIDQFANTPGVFDLDLTGLGASSQNGILLVSGAKNENNFAMSRANTNDGTFTIFNHNLSTNGANYELDPVSFVYLDSNNTGVVFGRVEGDASTEVSSDVTGFSVSNGPNNGEWFLTIDGHNDSTGTLIISPEGGGNFNVDNIISYEFDSTNNRWVIQSRDLLSASLQSVDADEPAFSFAFFADPVPEPSALVLVGLVSCLAVGAGRAKWTQPVLRILGVRAN